MLRNEDKRKINANSNDDSDSFDEDQVFNKGKNMQKLDAGKFEQYNKYLNVLLLKFGDPFLAQKYKQYMNFKRRGKVEERKANFYERM